jgi:hypothetical protein
MNNATQQIQCYNLDVSNPVVAATVLGLALIAGVCYCTTITVNAKYNRNVELTCKDLSLKIYSPVSTTTAVPVQS